MADTTSQYPQHESATSLDLGVRVISCAVGANQFDIALPAEPSPAPEATCHLLMGHIASGEAHGMTAARIARSTLTTAPDYLEQLYTFSQRGSPANIIVAYLASLSADSRAVIESAVEIVKSVGTGRPIDHRPATLYRFVGGVPAHDARYHPMNWIGAPE